MTSSLKDPTTEPVPGSSGTSPDPRSYPFISGPTQWWRGLLAVVGVIVVMAIGQVLGVLIGLLAVPFPELNGGLLLGPIVLVGMNVALMLLIPGSLLISKLLYGEAKSLFSVAGRIRWGLMARAAIIVVPVWALFIGSALLSGVQPPSPTVWALIVICLLTTPLQAAGEEMAFRGLLFRATATWAPRGAGLIVGMVVSSALFATAHFVANPWMASYYFIFGLSLAIIAWRLGGLEVPMLIHAVHNTFSFLVGLLGVGSIDALATRNEVDPGPAMLIYDAVFLGAAGIVWLVSLRKKPA